jgi:CO/xanthine dehydrogenase Mo-binding subunit
VKVARGVAIAESFKSIVAEVAEIEIDAKNEIRVTKVWAAVGKRIRNLPLKLS